MTEAELKIWAAFAAAAASLAVAIVSGLASMANQRAIQRLQFELGERRAERDAARDYRYEALKRLYHEFEPIRFHLVEACSIARVLMREIVQRPQEGARPSRSYYRAASAYNLLAPAAYFQLLKYRLTLVDLEIVGGVALQYQLAKQFSSMLTRDHDIARISALPYLPYVAGWQEKRMTNPQVHRRQGLPPGRLENALMAFLGKGGDDKPFVKSFGEYELLVEKVSEQDFSSPLGVAADLFADLDPLNRPVLWRLLIAQSILYEIFEAAVKKGLTTTAQVAEELECMKSRACELDVCGGETRDAFAFITTVMFPSLVLSLARSSVH